MNTQSLSDIQVNLKIYTCYVKEDCTFSTSKYDILKRHTATHKNEDNIETVMNSSNTNTFLSSNNTSITKTYSPPAKKQNYNKKQKLYKKKIKWKVELLKDGDLDSLAVQDKRQIKWKVELLKNDQDELTVQDKRQTKWKVELLKDDQDELTIQDKRQTKWKVELLKDGGDQEELTVQDESDSHLNEANMVVTESDEDMISKLPTPDWAKEESLKTSGFLEEAKQWATLRKPTFETCPQTPYQPPIFYEIMPNDDHHNPGEERFQQQGFPKEEESSSSLQMNNF